MQNIAVLGAGITGITTAAKLHEQGFNVTVIDRQRYAAMDTSFANGGQLSASNAEVWNTWSTILKGLKWMLQSDAPLLVNPKPSWHKISWMLEFMGNIPNYERNTIATTELAIASRKHMHALAKRWGVEYDTSDCGILHFYSDKKDFEHARRVNKLLAKGGLERFELSPSEIIDKEPQLHGDFVGGFWTPSDFTGDIHKYAFGLAEAIRKDGVNFLMETELVDVKTEQDVVRLKDANGSELEFDGIVVCLGVGSRALAAKLGDRINIYPVKGYSITVNLRDEQSQQSAPIRSLLDDKAKIVTSRLGVDRFRIAGTAEFNGYNRDIRADRIKPLVDWCQQHFPDVSTESVVPWAGLRPMMPNMMPKVGPGRRSNVFYNTGHGHLGWTLSAATADLVTAAVVEARDGNQQFKQLAH
ncbi:MULTISPECIES: D-amino acid dehydrogenase [unclassified Marinobacterium]|uniref:D-amino acid dehydrogenase n=1 Tax=unclassified Marinobacterium TaxID=2644139 RepID=UPI00156876FE|nr:MULTISPECIES: D-amino acid dehydrogenase [unclassified Marinobacterium]NRP26606.1 D-amino acid dehydrogenase small subunit [Marinobacterium sp. xm-d-420]NRP56563.1 D-amino acid dehydrogenase small subunit [Marinobacterium sp. xm-d-510]NRP96648.1 D-amino acid dehydrogenase small subunit [Marinobacterium sp. xm-a-127]